MSRRYIGGSHFKKGLNASSPLERVLILIVLVAVVALSAGLGLPSVSDTAATVTGEYTATGSAADTLAKLTVNDKPSWSGYDREYFGFRQTDDDGDGCDVREAVLARDLTNVTYKYSGSCKVKTGTLQDPYTGKTIHFTRGSESSKAVQIDHVVALENAWASGANEWDTAKRYKFGNDMYNLLAVDGDANQDKGSESAAYWLPSNADYRCEYVARQIGVKDKYGLSVTTKEKKAMLAVLHGCSGQAVPKD